MPAIDRPSAAESREDYDINNPWTDPVNGGEWWFSPTKVRWHPVPAGGGASVSDAAYDATSWNGVTDEAPSKNALRDKFESLPTVTVDTTITDGSTNAVSSNAVFDALALKAPLASPTFTGPVKADTHQATTTAGMVIKNSAGVALMTIGKTGGTYLTGVAEGQTTASGDYSHAEGYETLASGDYSHAEGYETLASGNYSHAAGRRAQAANRGSRVMTDGQDADCPSTAADQCTLRYLNGYRFLGGAADFAVAPTVTGSGTLALTSDINTLAKLDTLVADATLARADAGQTFEGLQQFSTRPRSSAALTPAATTELITLADAKNINRNRRVFHLSNFTGATFASGTSQSATIGYLSATCGAVVGNQASVTFGTYMGMSPGSAYQVTNFSKPITITWDIIVSDTTLGSNESRYLWPVDTSYTGGRMTTRGIGFLIYSGNVYGCCHNGTTHYISGGSSVVHSTQCALRAESDGVGNITFYKNGVSFATLATGPTGNTGSTARRAACSCENIGNYTNAVVALTLEITSEY